MSEFDDFDSQLGDDADSVWLNDLFERTRLPGTAEELSSEAEVIGAMVLTIAQPPLVSDLNARRRLGVSKTATRTAIVVAALLVGTSTAAASGNLPDAAQSALSRASSHLGVDIPDPYQEVGADQHDSSAEPSEPATIEPAITEPSTTSIPGDDPSEVTVALSEVPSTNGATLSTSPTVSPTDPSPGQEPVPPDTTSERGPDSTGPAKKGLCRAWAAHGGDSPANRRSTAMKNLQAAAAAVGQTVAEFCADVLGATPGEVAPTTNATSPSTTIAGEETEKKDKKEPGPGDNAPPDKDKKDKKPKGGS